MGLRKSENNVFSLYLLHNGHRNTLSFYSEKRKRRQSKTKDEILLMEECILMDVEQVTGNRCAQISGAGRETGGGMLKC